mgnify:CR=1 FL=1
MIVDAVNRKEAKNEQEVIIMNLEPMKECSHDFECNAGIQFSCIKCGSLPSLQITSEVTYGDVIINGKIYRMVGDLPKK